MLAKLKNDRTVQVFAAACLVLLLGAMGAAAYAVVSAQDSASSRSAFAEQGQDLAAAQARITELEGTVEQYKPAYLDARKNESKRSELASKESTLAAREKETAEATSKLDEREAAVKAREDAARANANASDWWIDKVRECLARPGQSRIASITESSLIGRDSSCYTG